MKKPTKCNVERPTVSLSIAGGDGRMVADLLAVEFPSGFLIVKGLAKNRIKWLSIASGFREIRAHGKGRHKAHPILRAGAGSRRIQQAGPYHLLTRGLDNSNGLVVDQRHARFVDQQLVQGLKEARETKKGR